MRSLLMIVAAALALVGRAAEPRAPLPDATPVPLVVGSAEGEAALVAARESGRALVADLTLGHDGVLVAADSAQPLAPGRYRLQALVATMPHDHILVDAVALRLRAGEHEATFARRERFPKPGELSPVHLDFEVDQAGPVTVRAEWFVGDTMLDLAQYRHVGKAREVYRAQRQSAINQYRLRQQGGAAGATTRDAPELGLGLGEELAEGLRLRPRALAGDELPPYRLLLAGLRLERLTPVSVTAVRTDQPAYRGDASGRLTVALRNHGAEPAKVALEWTVSDDDAPGEALATGREDLTIAGGEAITHSPEAPFPVAGVTVVGRVTVRVAQGELRPAQNSAPFVILPPKRPPPATDKRIFAHYMACWPIGYGALPYERRHEGQHLKHESKDEKVRRGGHVRNYALAPPDLELSPTESAELEIRRALRIGIDGFAIDAWAGGENAQKTFDALIRTAEAKDLPFALTLCIDPACGGRLDSTVQWLLERYGDSPKLARRQGKPLIFGYFSAGPAWGFAERKLGARTEAERFATRQSPLAWHLAGAAFSAARERVGQPVFYHFDYGGLRHPYHHRLSDADMVPIVGVIANYVDAVGAFSGAGQAADEMAAAARAAGAEWSDAPGMYQKENIPFEVYAPLGTEWLEGKWHGLRARDATLPQLITWNDYGENSNIAPGYETRYTLYDLTGYHIAWWKTGKPPTVERDRLYLVYAKYPRGARVWPFAQGVARPRKLEVLTILTAPATVRLPGRDIEFEAPAGYSRRQFPLAAGPVIAELVREGEVVTRLESPEPITDRPFRESNGLICYSTEFERHWRADFPDAEPFLYGEYADADADGLPNWFEMYWFTEERGFRPVRATDPADLLDEPEEHPVTRWLDTSTMTLVAPAADPDRDGRTNLQEYRDRTDPTVPAVPGAPAAADPASGLFD